MVVRHLMAGWDVDVTMVSAIPDGGAGTAEMTKPQVGHALTWGKCGALGGVIRQDIPDWSLKTFRTQ